MLKFSLQNLYAIVEFSTVDTVQYILSVPVHRLNSCQIHVKSRELQVPGQPVTNQFQQGYRQFESGGQLGRGNKLI